MFISTWTTAGLLMAFVMLTSQSSEREEPSDTCVWVGVEFDLDYGHNSSGPATEMWCEAPEKPLNGGYASESEAGGHKYNTGDTVQYYCNRGHQLIGQSNRTCNGTSKGWQPEEPYCEPEYVGHLIRRLNGIEDQMRVIEQRITTIENNTLQIGHNISDMRNEVKAVDNRVSAMNKTMLVVNNKVSDIDNKVSAIYNMSITEFVNWHMVNNRERLDACTDITKAISEDTVSKCMTMQMGVRNGHSVSVYKWVIKGYMNKVTTSRWVPYNSSAFYHRVPGYKLRLTGYIDPDTEIRIYMPTVPGEYDDQLTVPFRTKLDLTILTNDSTEVPHSSYSGDQSACQLNQATNDNKLNCYTHDSNWHNVYGNRKHILKDGSVVITLYLYN